MPPGLEIATETLSISIELRAKDVPKGALVRRSKMKEIFKRFFLPFIIFALVALFLSHAAQATNCGSSELWVKSIWPALVELDPLTLKVKDSSSYWIINKSNASPYGNYAWGLSGVGPGMTPSIYYLHTIYNFNGTTTIYQLDLESGTSSLFYDLSSLGTRAYGLTQNGDSFYVSYGSTVRRVNGGNILLPEAIGGLDFVSHESGDFLLAIASEYTSHQVYKIPLDENGDPMGTFEIATTIQAGLDSLLYPYKYTSVSYARIRWEDQQEREVLYVTKDDGSIEPWDIAAIVDFQTGEILRGIDSRESGIVVNPPKTWPNGVTSDYLSWANPQGIEYINGRLFLISRQYWNKGPLDAPCQPSIDVEKSVSVDHQGTWIDADETPGPEVPVGHDVYFKFVVTNNGSLALTNLTLTDTVINLGEWSLPMTLAPGATFECVVGPLQAIQGQHSNTATATDESTGITVSDSDLAHYYGQKTPSGTTLSASKTATGFSNKQTEYDWSLQKLANPTGVTISRGESVSVAYTITVERTKASETESYGVTGQICVTNGGEVTTENLKLVDQVQYKDRSGQYQDLSGASQVILPSQQLFPGESACYSYEIRFSPAAATQYRNRARVTITNHSGHSGDEFGPEPKVDFLLPSTPTTTTEMDTEAEVTDVLVCPSDFTCIPDDVGPWHFSQNGTVTVTLLIQNDNAPYQSTFTLTNTATLLESETNQERVSSATVRITTDPGPSGCTRTIGYWKTHSEKITPLLPVWLGTGSGKSIRVTTAPQAVQILSMSSQYGSPSNGITKLYAQLLAAKLNMLNGADGADIASTLLSADEFLNQYDWRNWKGLSPGQKQTVLDWKTTLDNYNNGLIGPGHCQEAKPLSRVTGGFRL